MLGAAAAALALLVLLLPPLLDALATRIKQWRCLGGVPAVRARHWLSGSARDLASRAAPLRLAAWANEHGGVFRVRLWHRWAVIVTEPQLVRVLLAGKAYMPKDRAPYRAIEVALPHPACPTVLTASDGAYQRAVRAAWLRCFTSPNLRQHVLPPLLALCDEAVAELRAGAAASASGAAAVDLASLTERITLDGIGLLAIGRSLGAVQHRRTRYLQLVAAMLREMHASMQPPLLTAARRLLRPREARQAARLKAEWDAANEAEVQRVLTEAPGDHTIAGQLLRVIDPATGAPLAHAQLRAELVLALLAGFETTSSALQFTLAALACHPHAMARLEQELDAAGLLASAQRPRPAPFAWAQLGRLPWLQACIREALRLFSPAALGSWRLSSERDTELRPGLVIPQGTPVGVPLFALGHSQAVYGADAADFRPERWLAPGAAPGPPGLQQAAQQPASSSAEQPPQHWRQQHQQQGQAATPGSSGSVARPPGFKPPRDPWTFSIGPRDCAGQALARLELQAVAATLLGQLRLQLAPAVGAWSGLLARRTYAATLQVEGGLPVLFTPRVP